MFVFDTIYVFVYGNGGVKVVNAVTGKSKVDASIPRSVIDA